MKRIILPLLIASSMAFSANALAETKAKSNIVMLGDSIFAYPLTTRVSRNMKKQYGIEIQSFAENGAHFLPESISVIEGLPPFIRQFINRKKVRIKMQFDNFVKNRIFNIDYVILDGGGNDIFANEELCLENGCESVLQDISDAQMEILETLEDYGVKNVIYQGYYRTEGPKAQLVDLILAGNKLLEGNCRKFEFCSFVNPEPHFRGKKGMITSDGVHPTNKGSLELANLLYQKLQQLLTNR